MYIWFTLAKKFFNDKMLLLDGEGSEGQMLEKCFTILNLTFDLRPPIFAKRDYDFVYLLKSQDLFPDIWNFNICDFGDRLEFVFGLWAQVESIKVLISIHDCYRSENGKTRMETGLYLSEYDTLFQMMKILAQLKSDEARSEFVDVLNQFASTHKLTLQNVCDAFFDNELRLWMGWPSVQKERLAYVLDLYSALNEYEENKRGTNFYHMRGAQEANLNFVERALRIINLPMEIQAEIFDRAEVEANTARKGRILAGDKNTIINWVFENCRGI